MYSSLDFQTLYRILKKKEFIKILPEKYTVYWIFHLTIKQFLNILFAKFDILLLF